MMQSNSFDEPKHILHRFVLWFSLLSLCFFWVFFSLRQDPSGIEIRDFYVPLHKQANVIEGLKDIRRIPFSFDNTGSQIVFNQINSIKSKYEI